MSPTEIMTVGNQFKTLVLSPCRFFSFLNSLLSMLRQIYKLLSTYKNLTPSKDIVEKLDSTGQPAIL